MKIIISHATQAYDCNTTLTSRKPLYHVTRNHDALYANVVEPV